MAVADHFRRAHASLLIDRVADRAGTLQPGVQRPLRIDRRLLGNRQVLPAGSLGRCSLSCALSRFGARRCLGLAALRVQSRLLSLTFALLLLLLPATLLLFPATLLLAPAFQLLLALLLGLALPFGALEGQVGLLHLRGRFDLDGGGGAATGSATGSATGGSGSTGAGGGRLISWVCITWVATGICSAGDQLPSNSANSPACIPRVSNAAPAGPIHWRGTTSLPCAAGVLKVIITAARLRPAPR